MDITGINYEEYKSKFGTVVYEGKVYWLTAVADFSNRPFPGWWGDAQEGDLYTAEFSCPAVDGAGDEWLVYWQFEAVKGQEPEDNGAWPWDEENIARVVSL
jgi:hypothetical protein